MSEIRDEPAFPTTQYANGVSPTGHDHGMSMRDYFAAKAMQALIETSEYQLEVIPRLAYQLADGMLVVRAEDE